MLQQDYWTAFKKEHFERILFWTHLRDVMDSAASEPIKSLSSLVEPGNSRQRGRSLARRRAAALTSVSYSCRIYDNARAEALRVAALWFQQVLDAFDLVLQPGIQSKRGGSSEGWHRLETADGREWLCWQEVTNHSMPSICFRLSSYST